MQNNHTLLLIFLLFEFLTFLRQRHRQCVLPVPRSIIEVQPGSKIRNFADQPYVIKLWQNDAQ